MGESATTQQFDLAETFFDVNAALAAASICDEQVSKLVGTGTETQFKFRGVIQEEKPLRDWLQEVLMNCLGYYTFAFGKLKIGVRVNSSAAEASTEGNILFRSLQLASLKPSFNHLTDNFADEDFEFVGNSVAVYDIDPANDRVSVTIAASPPEAGEITNALGYVPANRAGDHFTGAIDCGPHQTIGDPLENMAKHSENFASATWDNNDGSCSVTSNSIIAPDGNQTADVVTAVTDTPVIQQQIAGLADGGTYAFYIWARVASGTRKVLVAIVNYAYATYLIGPTQITLTTSRERFKITGILASGQTGLGIVVRQYAANADDWTTGAIHLWGACLQQGTDPQKAYARTWASQTPHVASGLTAGPTVIAATDGVTSPLKIRGPGSNLGDKTLLELTAGGELIVAGGSGNGYRLAELMAANIPSGWAGVLKVKSPDGTTLGHILLYTNP